MCSGSWSPQICGGISNSNLHTKQTAVHIETLIEYHDLMPDPMVVLLWATGEVMQLELGLMGQLFEAHWNHKNW